MNYSGKIVQDKVGVLMILEAKFHSYFPEAKFYMQLYLKPYRLDKRPKGMCHAICQGGDSTKTNSTSFLRA